MLSWRPGPREVGVAPASIPTGWRWSGTARTAIRAWRLRREDRGRDAVALAARRRGPARPARAAGAVQGGPASSAVLAANAAAIFRLLATLVTDADLATTVSDLRWTGPTPDFPATANAPAA